VITGWGLLLQHTPLFVTGPDPSSVTVPPVKAVVPAISDTSDVVTRGTSSFMHPGKKKMPAAHVKTIIFLTVKPFIPKI